MLKVLMCGNHPQNKGGMTSVINQIKAYDWKKENIKIIFIPTYKPGKKVTKTVFFGYSYLKILWQMIINKPDIVHMHMSYKGSFVRKYYIHILCKFFGVKDIIHLHGSEFEKWYYSSNEYIKKKIRKLLEEVSCVIVLGEEWEKVIRKITPDARIETISNGIKIPSKTVSWRKDKCEVLFLGVLILRKGVTDLLKAISLLDKKNRIGNMHFTIAGTGSEEERLKYECRKLNIEKVVTFVGWIDGEKKKYYLENSQIMVSPSYNEGLPISILEAISYGMPVVSTDVGDISHVVRNNKNGILVKPGDIDGLAEALLNVSKEENFINMSKMSKKIAEEDYNLDHFYCKLKNIYFKL